MYGLGTELSAHNKARKLSNASQTSQDDTQQQPQGESIPTIDGPPPAYEEVASSQQPTFDSKAPDSRQQATHAQESIPRDVGGLTAVEPLPFPVIIPQRRPNDKSRGFARAYAPDLGAYKDIDQTTFLSFLEEFDKSSQASGWFVVLNLAAVGAGFAPSVIAMAVSASVQLATKVAMEGQRRYRTNAYLDKINAELFHPVNLHVMVMSFKPEASDTAVLDVGLDSSPSAASALNGLVGKSKPGKFRTSDGKTHGELELPETAELIYPDAATLAEITSHSSSQLADAAAEGSETASTHKKDSAWKSNIAFLQDYKDRRAQAKYAAQQGEDSKLAVPGAADSSNFASKYSDPNSNTFGWLDQGAGGRRRGGLLGGAIGGALDVPDRRAGRRDRSRNGDRYHRRDDYGGRGGLGRGSVGGRGGLVGGVKSIMKQDLLYLLIAEIPEELKEEVLRADQQQRNSVVEPSSTS
jgi:hypothetical protein